MRILTTSTQRITRGMEGCAALPHQTDEKKEKKRDSAGGPTWASTTQHQGAPGHNNQARKGPPLHYKNDDKDGHVITTILNCFGPERFAAVLVQHTTINKRKEPTKEKHASTLAGWLVVVVVMATLLSAADAWLDCVTVVRLWWNLLASDGLPDDDGSVEFTFFLLELLPMFERTTVGTHSHSTHRKKIKGDCQATADSLSRYIWVVCVCVREREDRRGKKVGRGCMPCAIENRSSTNPTAAQGATDVTLGTLGPRTSVYRWNKKK